MTSHLEQQFAALWLSLYPTIDLHSEHQFSCTRRYRFDFCHVPSKVAIEIQGGIWQPRSAHNSGRGLTRDFEKLNLATSEGWRVFLLSGDMITDERLHAIASAIQPPKLPNKPELLGNSPTARELRQQRDYVGHIRPKTIKGKKYYYWIYYERGKRVEKYMGTDFDRAIAIAQLTNTPDLHTPNRYNWLCDSISEFAY
jgi:very-short-patch-repair endonuclease